MVHLLRIIFNFLFCLIPISYSTEIFAKFFHLPPPICIQLPDSQIDRVFVSPLHSTKCPHLSPKANVLCVLLSARLYESFQTRLPATERLREHVILMFSGLGGEHLPHSQRESINVVNAVTDACE